ncbi:MAG: hypothetical protein AAF927_17730 [Bacteroidota bacterium]
MKLVRTLILTITLLYVGDLVAQLEKGRIQFGAELATRLEIGDGFLLSTGD